MEPSRKRKGKEIDESGHNNEEPTTHKRPRCVWTPALHQKFVAAVNHLGIDKAVPKKILEVMDVDTLTRDHIASHLQALKKYKMNLKKLSNENAPEGLGGRTSFEALNNVEGRYRNSLHPHFVPSLGGFLGEQLNSGGFSSTRPIQSDHDLQNSMNPHVKLQSNNGLPSFPNGNLLQGAARGFQQEPTQAGKAMSHLDGYNHGHFPTDNYMDPKMVMNGSNTNHGLMVSGPSQFLQTRHSPLAGSFKIGGTAGSSNAWYVNNDSWKPVAQNPLSSLQKGATFTLNQLPQTTTHQCSPQSPLLIQSSTSLTSNQPQQSSSTLQSSPMPPFPGQRHPVPPPASSCLPQLPPAATMNGGLLDLLPPPSISLNEAREIMLAFVKQVGNDFSHMNEDTFLTLERDLGLPAPTRLFDLYRSSHNSLLDVIRHLISYFQSWQIP